MTKTEAATKRTAVARATPRCSGHPQNHGSQKAMTAKRAKEEQSSRLLQDQPPREEHRCAPYNALKSVLNLENAEKPLVTSNFYAH